MISLTKIKYSQRIERPAAPGVEIRDEGRLLKSVLIGGEEHLAPTQGAPGEVIVGFSFNSNYKVTEEVVIEDTLEVPAAGPYTVQLANNNLIAGSLFVYNETAGSEIDFNAAVGAGQYNVDLVSGKLTFNAAQASAKLYVAYRYNLTAIKAMMKYRDRPVNTADATEFANLIAVGGEGEIFTNAFDSSVSYDGVSSVYAGADGLITSVATGHTKVPARITKLPTAASPFIGLAFNL